MLIAALLRRGTRLYLIARAAICGLLLLAGDDPLRVPFPTTVGVLLICTILGYVETHLNHERALLGNLGLRRRALVPFFLLPAAVGELVIRLVAGAA